MRRIYARKTTVKQIDDKIADDFIDQYHDQGLVVFGKSRYNLGLFYNEELVGVVSFSNPRTRAKSRKYQHELVRMAFKTDTRVVGGASKMIKHYIDDYKPRNFFTYQTLSGERTDVYVHAGMILVEKGKTKQVLVKNGYTYETALQADEKYLYLNNQLVNLGPDNILKTKLGEVFENGKRLTNEELFIRFCDYHKETIPGDNVYEYNNPNYHHYIYKITNTNPDDNRYYIGRHSVYLPNKQTDTYMGSGGVKFQNWKTQTINKGYQLEKTILSSQTLWHQNIQEEERLVSTLITDENCLNVAPGGIVATVSNEITYSTKTCDTHGTTLYRNDTCCKCSYEKGIKTDNCDIHGETLFRGEYCLKCLSSKPIHQDICTKHGETTFNGSQCLQCQNEQVYTIQTCPTHGDTQHIGDACCKCTSQKGVTYDICKIHGKTAHRNHKCLTCNMNSVSFMDDYCPVHGHTKHRGQTCLKCANQSQIVYQECPIHGESKHRNGKCYKCRMAKLPQNQKRKSASTPKKVAKPKKPKKEKITEKKYCAICNKESRHVDNVCMSCKEQALYKMLDCPIHGNTKHRGKTCCKCRSEEMKRRRLEKKSDKENKK